jgi:hypothetical protein
MTEEGSQWYGRYGGGGWYRDAYDDDGGHTVWLGEGGHDVSFLVGIDFFKECRGTAA